MSRLEFEHITLLINSLGNRETRGIYNRELFRLPLNSIRKPQRTIKRETLAKPLRVLDSKREEDLEVISSAPTIQDFLSPEDGNHFESVCDGLTSVGIPFVVSLLVRDLTTTHERPLSSQRTNCKQLKMQLEVAADTTAL